MIVAPPNEVQQRAWECAYVLRADFDELLPLEQRVRCEVVLRSAALGWENCQEMFRLYDVVAGVRV